jgi:type IV pilus assembly protein PilA
MRRSEPSPVNGEAGFTLVELLAVMLIIGLLAAIAIPAFFNQRDKARDAGAKAAARTAELAIEAYSTDNEGHYTAASPADLVALEPTLAGAALAVSDEDGSGVPGAKTYRVSVTSSAGNRFWIARASSGQTTLGCDVAGREGCPPTGSWG